MAKIKFSFSQINIQPLMNGDDAPHSRSRYWMAEIHKTKDSNDFIQFSLRQGIKKRVMTNTGTVEAPRNFYISIRLILKYFTKAGNFVIDHGIYQFISSLARDSDDSGSGNEVEEQSNTDGQDFLMIPKQIKIRPTTTD